MNKVTNSALRSSRSNLGQDGEITATNAAPTSSTNLTAGFPGKKTSGLEDGLVGNICKVSCGSFNNGMFDVAYAWDYSEESRFKSLSYLSSAHPRNLRFAYQDSRNRGSMNTETYRVVYFVVDKPPQFYKVARATTVSPSSAVALGENPEPDLTTFRISHPSSVRRDKDDAELDVCGVPWIIQYSRVYKLEYNKRQDFNPQVAWPRQMTGMEAFSHPVIKKSQRTASDMATALLKNIQKLSEIFPAHLNGCRLGVIKLLYNCNISATSDQTNWNLSMFVRWGPPDHSRQFTEEAHRKFQHLKTCQFRALQWFYESSQKPSDTPANPIKDVVWSGTDFITAATRPFDVSNPGIFDIMVYPSHVEIQGPSSPPMNSVMDEYRHLIGKFLRVRFVDNDSKPLKVEVRANLDEILEHRVFRVLNNQSRLFPPLPILEGFEFLGYSMSSLKKRKAVWFFQRQDGLDAKVIRDRIGDWDVARKANPKLANHPSKWGARISLAFTESYLVLPLRRREWAIREDCGNTKGFPNTDGCGLISPELCDKINEALVPLGFPKSRAFQVRFGGVKGVVYAGERSLLQQNGASKSMLLRKSQVKLKVPDSSLLDLRIVSTAGGGSQSLFLASALKAFEDSGADTDAIEKIYDDAYASLTTASSKGLDLLQQIYTLPYTLSDDGIKGRHILLKLAIRLKEKGIHPEDYSNTFLAEYLNRLAERARDKDLFKIPIPGSFTLLGLTDDYQGLEENEVLIFARNRLIEGPVLIYRDPVVHIGDIQEATALGRNELEKRLKSGWPDGTDPLSSLLEMDNVIFFSQKDNPPFPNRLSGGDLDGDRFEVVTKQCRFWKKDYRTAPYDCYTETEGSTVGSQVSPIPVNNDQSFYIKQLARFIAQYIRNDCFADLERRLLALADGKGKEGMNNNDVKALAPWVSKAVDYAKSGIEVNLVDDVLEDRKFEVKKYPDFLHALRGRVILDSKTKYYESRSLLGRIYRKFKKVEYTSVQDRMDNEALLEKISQAYPEGVNVRHYKHMRSFGALFINDLRNQVVWKQGTSEVDLFLAKQQGDFPNNLVQKLISLTLHDMVRRGLVAWSELGPLRVQLVERDDALGLEEVTREYKEYLYVAWELAVILSRDSLGRKRNTYPFICLYALCCEELPIDLP